MGQVYLVFEGDHEHRRATAVFSSKWRAEEFAEVVCGEIEELPLNGANCPARPKRLRAWAYRAYIDAADHLPFPPERVSCRDFKQCAIFSPKHKDAKLLMWARDDWHAERIAKAWRMKLALLNKWHAGHGLDANIVLRAGEDF